MKKINVIAITCLCLIGCAANTHLTEVTVFSDRFTQDTDRLRAIIGFNASASYSNGLDHYGNKHFGKDSLDPIKYLKLNEGMGVGIGVLKNGFAFAVSAQMLMIGADATYRLADRAYISGYLTSNLSHGISFYYRINTIQAIGPFYKSERFDGIGSEFLLPEIRKGRSFYGKYFGVKGLFYNSGKLEQSYFAGIGYSPSIRGISVFIGVDAIRIF
ncbi:hypothetical protein JNL27_14460 [bacterium]|nr:hypothetical protein [bacterium]